MELTLRFLLSLSEYWISAEARKYRILLCIPFLLLETFFSTFCPHFFFHLQPLALLYQTVLSQHPSALHPLSYPYLPWVDFLLTIPLADTYANSKCVSAPARVPKSERISRNERLLTVGKNYLNWNWSFHRPSRRLLHVASSYPPSCRSIPSKSE